MPHGILFRGRAEGTIRKGMVEADLFGMDELLAGLGYAPDG